MVFDTIKKFIFRILNKDDEMDVSTAIVQNENINSLYAIVENSLKDNVSAISFSTLTRMYRNLKKISHCIVPHRIIYMQFILKQLVY